MLRISVQIFQSIQVLRLIFFPVMDTKMTKGANVTTMILTTFLISESRKFSFNCLCTYHFKNVLIKSVYTKKCILRYSIQIPLKQDMDLK